MNQTLQAKSGGTVHLVGLDSIRFLCALWVVFFHGNLPPIVEGLDHIGSLNYLIRGVVAGFFNGHAAVIVFFVISGFCIHFPQRETLQLDVPRFYVRRAIRVGFPAFAAIMMGLPFGISFSNFLLGIGWSLIAELGYYLVYPGILRLRARFGWKNVLVGAFAAALCILVSKPLTPEFMGFGIVRTTILGLPCWLLGCLLAETLHQAPAIPVKALAIPWVRFGVWLASSLILSAFYWMKMGEPWTLTVFAVLVYFWLHREIQHFQTHAPSRMLEWAGTWSYSIYLTHMTATCLLKQLKMPDFGSGLNWLLAIAFILGCAYLFYLLIEVPSRTFAKRFHFRSRTLFEHSGKAEEGRPMRSVTIAI